jgi:hypothetical protein
MIPTLETERMCARPVRQEDAEQVQKIFPQREVVKHFGAVVPWPNPPDGALQFYRDLAIPQMERGEAWHWTPRLKTAPEPTQIATKAHGEKAAALIGPWLTVSSFGFLECLALAPNAIGFLGVWIGPRARAAVGSV